jgi:Fic family protein
LNKEQWPLDREKFSGQSPGSLVRVQTPDPDWAFVPAPLPAAWALPTELYPKLISAREKLARLDGAGRFMPASSILLRPLQQREAIKSSRLEGTFATAEELLAYGLEPKDPSSQADPVNSWREVFNYDSALQKGQKTLEELPLSNRAIRELHNVLLSGVRGADRTPGEFRKRQVHIGSDRRFVPAPPADIEDLMGGLETYMNEEEVNPDPLVRSFLAHYQFETIHPFLDGNGRVGRLLLSLMVWKTCGLQQPWLYLSAYFEKHKDDYIEALFDVSTRGNWAGWVHLCLNATIAETQDAMARIDRLLELKKAYEAKINQTKGAPARLHNIVSSLLAGPIVTIPSLAAKFDVTFPTAQADVGRLMRMQILARSTRRTKPQYYIAREIFSAAYMETD